MHFILNSFIGAIFYISLYNENIQLYTEKKKCTDQAPYKKITFLLINVRKKYNIIIMI